ncbi:MAG: type II secretion system F family protein [Planctomycetota bacterium]|nr:type II secretion system F family protein [Planctomycetota bacterium]
MPIFEYKAYASGGRVQAGVIDADTTREARNRLRRENLLVSEIHELRGGRRTKGKLGPKGKKLGVIERLRRQRQARATPSMRDLEVLTSVTRQMGTLLSSGIPLAETLKAIIEQAERRDVEMMFREIRERINSGGSLADALSEHPRLFGELYVNMVRAGEATGNVDVVLRRLADYLQAQRALRRKIVSAMTYPAMMIAIGMIVVSILMAVVVPKITGMLTDQGKTLPAPTQVLIFISDLFKDWWWAGALAIAAVSFAIERIYRTDKGRMFIDKNMLRIPILGDLLRKQAVSRFTRTLSTLLQSGVPAVQSLEITRTVVGNRVLADATEHIRVKILEGTDISTPLKATGVFPPVVSYMVAIGEQSGELEQMLDRVAIAYDEEIDVATERMTSVIEPIMIVVLAVIVGYIVISIVLPILQIGQVG